MTVLEKVIFVADFISADRDYDGVERMRKIADKDLDEAVLDGMAFTIADLAQRKISIAPETFSGYNYMVNLKNKK